MLFGQNRGCLAKHLGSHTLRNLGDALVWEGSAVLIRPLGSSVSNYSLSVDEESTDHRHPPVLDTHRSPLLIHVLDWQAVFRLLSRSHP